MRLNIFLFSLFFITSCSANQSLLPEDLFIHEKNTNELLKIQNIEGQVYQIEFNTHGKSLVGAGSAISFIIFCTSSKLSSQNGYSGWSLAETKDDSSTVFTIALTNQRSDIKKYNNYQWSQKLNTEKNGNETFKEICSTMIKPEYMW